MKIFIVVLISVGLHVLGYFTLQNTKISDKIYKQKNIKTTSNIKYVNLKAKKVIKKKKPIKKIKKNKITKKQIKKPKIKPKPKPKAKIKQKTKPKPIKKIIKKPIKKPIKKVEIKPKKEKPKKENIDPITQSYLDLYGKEFKNYPKQTQIYLIKNLKDIGSITKIFLEYPYMSIQAHQQGVSVVEFMLYPDGHIEDLKTIKTSNYFLLDDNTIETIQAAYSDYPRPLKPTVIRIYVKYQLVYN